MENEFPESVLGTLGGMRVPATTETKDIFCNIQVTMEMRLSTRLIFNSSTDASLGRGYLGTLLHSAHSIVRTHGCQFNIGELNILTSSFVSPDSHPREWVRQCFCIRPPVVKEKFRCWALEMT